MAKQRKVKSSKERWQAASHKRDGRHIQSSTSDLAKDRTLSTLPQGKLFPLEGTHSPAVSSKVMRGFSRPGKGCLHFPVLLLPHGCTDIIHSELVALSFLVIVLVGLCSTACLQEGQGHNAQPRHMCVCVIVEAMQRLLGCTIVFPVVIHLQVRTGTSEEALEILQARSI